MVECHEPTPCYPSLRGWEFVIKTQGQVHPGPFSHTSFSPNPVPGTQGLRASPMATRGTHFRGEKAEDGETVG